MRRSRRLFCALAAALSLPSMGVADDRKIRLVVVDSYHRESRGSQETHQGFCAGLLKFGYLDAPEQAETLAQQGKVESSRAVVEKLWMDTKRKSEKPEMVATTTDFVKAIQSFKPDLVFLGDDNAANHIGNSLLDTDTPVVFWGVNNTPVKYKLVDTMERPGHNVTGIYQAGYYAESLQLLKALVPQAKTFAVLSDGTETGRSHVKAIEFLAREGKLPLELVTTVATNDFVEWTAKALEIQGQVDALFVAQYAAMRDEQDRYVPAESVARWYLSHITIPEAVGQRQFVEHGLLCAADDSLYNQGFEAVAVAHDMLATGAKPATYPPRAPARGALMVNAQRTKALGIALHADLGIEETINESSALQRQSATG